MSRFELSRKSYREPKWFAISSNEFRMSGNKLRGSLSNGKRVEGCLRGLRSIESSLERVVTSFVVLNLNLNKLELDGASCNEIVQI